MKIIRAHLKENSYNIVVGQGILPQLGKALQPFKMGKDAVVITNPVIRRLHGPALAAGLARQGITAKFFEVPDGEKSKSAKVATHLLGKIARYDTARKIFIIAFGGGVIGDLAGFVAAVYKRGIPYVQVPTTLLAQVDSAIGGKVAIDLPVGKNLVGAIYQPKIVWSDVNVLKTIADRPYRNGFAEIIKYGVIRDRKLFDYVDAKAAQLLSREPAALMPVIVRCSQIKANVVMADEKETKGIRTILNFGHTVGHALEAASGYRLFHGEAIAHGIVVAAEISLRMGMFSQKDFVSLQKVLRDFGLVGRRRALAHSGPADIFKHMQHDKKFEAGRNRFVLAEKIGRVKVVEGIPPQIIREALRKWL